MSNGNTRVTNMNVVCDKCKHEFKVKPNRIKTKYITDDVEKMFFKCLKCKEEYIVGYRDSEVRENIERIVNIVDDINQNRSKYSIKEIESLQKEYGEFKDRNIELSNRYKALFAGGFL